MRFSRHAGPDPAYRRSRKSWIPAFAGMTILIERAIYKQTLVKLKSEKKEKFYNIFVSSNPYIIRKIGFSNY